jgi:hypothetical protein
MAKKLTMRTGTGVVLSVTAAGYLYRNGEKLGKLDDPAGTRAALVEGGKNLRLHFVDGAGVRRSQYAARIVQ